jgi:muramoyltetrapeptide carboxypeptidase
MRIAVVAPACPLDPSMPERFAALVPPGCSLIFHPQCFLSWGHFAGTDAERRDALIEVANDPTFDAVWFARGGYGSNRIAEAALDAMDPAARNKIYLGYSDAGFLLAGLAARGIGRPVHGPMPSDIRRDGGEAAIARSLAYLADPYPAPEPVMAFNMVVFSHLIGTPLEPDLTGKILALEEVDEYHYRIDRSLFHITASPNVRRCAGIRLGRCAVPENDRPFFAEGAGNEESIVRHWCERAGLPYLGRADIGHDIDNAILPFG